MSFNTFGRRSKTYDSGKYVWFEVNKQYPVGGSVDLTGVAIGTVIPAGSMCAYDFANKTIKIVKAADIGSEEGETPATDIKGLLYHDIYVEEGTTYATGAVVYDGAIYADRLEEEIPAEVWANLPNIVAYNEKTT